MAGLKMKYFVLNPKSKGENDFYAAASRAAMLKYADTIRSTNEQLAKDLEKWVLAEAEATPNQEKLRLHRDRR